MFIGDIHGSLKQFLAPFIGRCDPELGQTEVELSNLYIDDIEKIFFMGDIFYGPDDCIIANTLSKLILEHENIEWILGNRDLLVFGKVLNPEIEINQASYSYKKSPFFDKRFETVLDHGLLRAVLKSGRVKIVSKFDKYLISHAAITEDGLEELRNVRSLIDIWNPEVILPRNLPSFTFQFESIEELNQLIDVPFFFFTKLKIIWNKRVFNAIQESIIGHEVFINEYPKEAFEKIQKFGSWLTDEFISMHVQCQEDRLKQFLLSEVHYQDSEIKTNIHHTDCNGQENPCFFELKNGEWIFNSGDETFKFEMVNFKGRDYKVISHPI